MEGLVCPCEMIIDDVSPHSVQRDTSRLTPLGEGEICGFISRYGVVVVGSKPGGI